MWGWSNRELGWPSAFGGDCHGIKAGLSFVQSLGVFTRSICVIPGPFFVDVECHSLQYLLIFLRLLAGLHTLCPENNHL